MKTSVILALFGFVFAVGFSVAVTESKLADTADEFQAKKLLGENDMETEDEQFDERAFDDDDDGDELGDEDDVRAIEKSADPFRLGPFALRLGNRLRPGTRRVRRPIRRVRGLIPRIRRRIRFRRIRRVIRRFRRGSRRPFK